MILSEFDELVLTLRENNVIEVFDAIVDIEYLNLQSVTRLKGTVSTGDTSGRYFANKRASHGLLSASGLGRIWSYLDKGLLAVHKSNMTKFCLTYDDAIYTCSKYFDSGTECYIEEKGGRFVILRKRDKKVMKCAVNYKPPTDDLRKILIDAGVISDEIN